LYFNIGAIADIALLRIAPSRNIGKDRYARTDDFLAGLLSNVANCLEKIVHCEQRYLAS
jgi:hypothetical protein